MCCEKAWQLVWCVRAQLCRTDTGIICDLLAVDTGRGPPINRRRSRGPRSLLADLWLTASFSGGRVQVSTASRSTVGIISAHFRRRFKASHPTPPLGERLLRSGRGADLHQSPCPRTTKVKA